MKNAFFYGFRISFRRLLKEKKYALINISGLAISMAAALLIFMYLQFESSYDTYHPGHQNIYRVASDITLSGDNQKMAINTVPLGPMLVDQVPEFTNFTRIFPVNYFFRNLTFRFQDKTFKEHGVIASDSTFFDFFAFDFVEGNADQALNKPYSIVLTQSMAQRYFGDQSGYGQLIEVEGAGTFQVTAIVSDPPLNSHLQLEGIISMTTMYQLDDLLAMQFQPGVSWSLLENAWGSRLVWVYVKTTEGFDPQHFTDNRWLDFYQTHIGELTDYYQDFPLFQPVADIHLRSKLAYEMTNQTGVTTMMSPETIRIFYAIALFLLIVASINYTNISISQFQNRAKEVGVKKVMGAGKTDLMGQFFSESTLTALFSFVNALLLIEVSLPSVNQLMGTELSLSFSENPGMLLFFLLVALLTGLLSGAYPATYFSRFSSLNILRSRFATGKSSLGLKKILIVLQFVISVFMIIATLVANRQLSYINSKDLGYDRENMVIVEMHDQGSRQNARVLQNTLLQSPYVEEVAISNYYPSILMLNNSVNVVNDQGPLNLTINIAQITPEYPEFMNMELAAGRWFDRQYPSDQYEAVLINEAAVKYFGWKDDPIGKEVEMHFQWPDGTPTGKRRVVGVIKDFHYTSLSNPIDPLAFYPMQDQGTYLNVKISEQSRSKGLQAIDQAWSEVRPNYPLEYHLLEDTIAGMYQSQRILSIFFAAFAILCIFIAFMGLYGLSAYSIEQRTREIGIRKVLGANSGEIIYILGKEFLFLTLLASAIASALAWYFTSNWLSGFAYHASLNASPFVWGIGSACLVAFMAIIIHAYRASQMNPAISVKCE